MTDDAAIEYGKAIMEVLKEIELRRAVKRMERTERAQDEWLKLTGQPAIERVTDDSGPF